MTSNTTTTSSSSSNDDNSTQTVDSMTAADYLNPADTNTPAEETGLNANFHSTYDPAMKEEAPKMPEMRQSAKEKLGATSSSMSTRELQQAAAEGDPNNLLRMGRK